jgi:hypothetical protein
MSKNNPTNPEEIQKLLGEKVKGVTPTSASEEITNGTSDSDLLGLMRITFMNPMASLLTYYVNISKGKRKSIEQAMLEFRESHPKWFKFACVVDGVFRFVYILVVFLVVIRGLALHEFIFDLIEKFNEI